MRCPTLKELPPPPLGTNVWPWAEESPQLPDTMPNDSPWPRISIVTPSYNQAQFIEETIRSVLLQGYPNLEYIIIDGGSTDGSVEIIKNYEPWLAYWVSEKDQGQSHAINKGFARANGEILAWLNSDDMYMMNALRTIAESFCFSSEKKWICGNSYMLDINGRYVESIVSSEINKTEFWLLKCPLVQPSTFWHISLWNQTKIVDENMQFSFDYELWLHFISLGYFPQKISNFLSIFRLHPESKTTTSQLCFFNENRLIRDRYLNIIKSPSQKAKIWLLLKEKNSRFMIAHLQNQNTRSWRWKFVFLLYLPWILAGKVIKAWESR